MEATPSTPTNAPVRRAALVFIFVTVLIDILSFGLIIPVFPHLLAGFLGGDLARAAVWHGWITTAFFAMQFVFAPVQGALSDWVGRRPVILLSNLGLGLDFLLMALANTLPLLFIGRVISGITSASFSTANAYIADVTPPEKRAQAFGMIGMAFGIGFVIAPVIGSALSLIHERLPFWVAVVLCLANFIYGLFVLPESLPKEKRTPHFDWAHANPIGALKLLRRYPQVLGLIGVLFLMALAHMVYPTTFVLYADYRFGWGQFMVGVTLGLVGVLSAVVQGGLVKPIVKTLGERRTLLTGLVCGAVGFCLYALAPTGYWFWAMMPITTLWGLAQPAAQAIMSHHVDPREQGRLQGAVSSLSSVAGILAPTLFTQLFAAVAAAHIHGPAAGATFWLAASLLGAGLILAWYAVSHLPPAIDAGGPAPEAVITSTVLAGVGDIDPPADDSHARG